jgi:hypothetical protein
MSLHKPKTFSAGFTDEVDTLQGEIDKRSVRRCV